VRVVDPDRPAELERHEPDHLPIPRDAGQPAVQHRHEVVV